MGRRARGRPCGCCCLLPLLLGIGLLACILYLRRAPQWPPAGVVRVTGSRGCMRPDWSPNGKELVFDRWPTGGIGILTLKDGKIRVLAPNGYEPSWSGDGKSILYMARFGPNATKAEKRATAYTCPVLCTPDGKTIFESDQRRMRLSYGRIDGRTGCIYGVAASRAGLGSRWGQEVVIAIDPKTDTTRIVTAPAVSQPGHGVCWSPDGKLAACRTMVGGHSGYRHQILITNIDGTHPRPLAGPETLLSPPSWSPDGKWIAVIAMRNSPGKKLMDRVQSSALTGRRVGDRLADAMVWALDSGAYEGAELWVLAADGSRQTMILNMGQTYDAYSAVTAANPPAWSPDGKRIAFVKDRAIWVARR